MTIDPKRTVLVIEDNELNREMLCAILSDNYDVMEAENGKIGLDILNEYKNKISLILLDIQMPVMNGYEFLEAVSKKQRYANIPIIVTTSSANAMDEINCLEKGASDFVAKPYKTDVVLRRVSSMIRLSEASALINRVEFDDLTGTFGKDFFYVHTENALVAGHERAYDLICSDVNAFRVINNRYGNAGGDALLTAIAEVLKKIPEAICGRIGEDLFACLLPHREEKEAYSDLLKEIDAAVKGSPVPNASVRLGIYRNVDHKLKASDICDDAHLAIESIRDQYGKRIAEYDERLKQKLIREQLIQDSMEEALEQKQFEVYYQPKHDLANDRTGGAEALIRWHHPEFGFMNPGEFIPLFEKNGFIRKLDRYIARRVCEDLREWKNDGLDMVPVSVNISRVDFEDPDLANELDSYARDCDVPCSMLHFEVTESAYTDNPEQIRNGVSALRKLGFRIELDDFGSGYSSLTVLDDLELDVLKLDMSLVRNYTSPKLHLILKHIFSMAEHLHMEVVAEGIETEEQVRAFRSMGCTFAQGYYYSKPIPKKNFEEYLSRSNKGD